MNFFDSKRSIVCALSMVALLSVALGHTIADYPVEKTPESLVEFVDQPIKKSVVINKNVVGLCSNPSIVGDCRVDVGSFGLDDSRKCGYVRTSGGSSEAIPKPNEIVTNRGIILFKLDPTTCTTTTRQQFDTWAVADDRVRLVEAMDSASPGTIIIGVSLDSAERNNFEFRNSANWFFTKYNMNLSGVGLDHRDKFAFIMQNGYPNKTIYRSARRVTMVTDVKFY